MEQISTSAGACGPPVPIRTASYTDPTGGLTRSVETIVIRTGRCAALTDQGRPEVAASLLESQRAYYDLRANDYGNASKPDRKKPGLMEAELGSALIDQFRLTGCVLELACGPGVYTSELARYAEAVTAVDASPRMLSIARSRIDDPKVTFVQADIFGWQPGRAYDAVFFGAWLSHVPPSAFDDFWALGARPILLGARRTCRVHRRR